LRTYKEDLRQWAAESTVQHTVNSYSKLLDKVEHPSTFTFNKPLWKGFAPSKIKMFLWLLLQHRISTRAFLVRRRLFNLSQATCPICNTNIKIVTHLFLHCHASWRLWRRFMNWFSISWCMPESIDRSCYFAMERSSKR
jgi:hypothetical protein